MITPYDPKSARQSPGDRFFHHVEARRYEWLEAQLRAAGSLGAADLCRRWADEHRLTVVRLDEADRRLAALDATLRGVA